MSTWTIVLAGGSAARFGASARRPSAVRTTIPVRASERMARRSAVTSRPVPMTIADTGTPDAGPSARASSTCQATSDTRARSSSSGSGRKAGIGGLLGAGRPHPSTVASRY